MALDGRRKRNADVPEKPWCWQLAEISVGGPGLCYLVERWNGKTYELNSFEYEGKRCKPPR